jgi:hypothetical protein
MLMVIHCKSVDIEYNKLIDNDRTLYTHPVYILHLMLTIQKIKVVIVAIIIDIVIIVDVIIIVGLVKGDKITCESHQEDALFHFHPH